MKQKQIYDIIVIGGGSGGLTVAAAAATLGAKVALIEKHKLGGECLWTGCVPSKALLSSAKTAQTIRDAKIFGLSANPKVHFSKVMSRIHSIIEKIEPHDSPKRFEKLGVDVFFGSAQFISKHTIKITNQILRAKKFVIATGSSPFIPNIKGLKSYLTNENIFELTKQPKQLLIIGGGPIAIEMAQAFANLGTKVSVIVRSSRILKNDDEELVQILEQTLRKQGVDFYYNTTITDFAKPIILNGKKIVYDNVLFATGRVANVSSLGLENIGIHFSSKGILVNNRLQTNIKNIYAIGDVTGKHQFTHIASYEATIVLANTLFHIPKKVDYTLVPWTTFTHPEIGRVGILESQKEKDDIVLTAKLSENDRYTTESEDGFVKLIVSKKGYIKGAHVIGSNAGELINMYTIAMKNKLTLQKIASAIHVYPTKSAINQTLVSKYYKLKLTNRTKKWLQRIFWFG